MTPRDDTDPSYLTAFRGTFTAALRWHQLDALWARIDERADAGWFIYAIGEPPPRQPTDASGVRTFIREIDQLLRDEHREDYCGIVYADDPRAPTFVKIYDPNNLGVVCGYSTAPPLPGWTLSLLAPVDLPSTRPPPKQRQHWWKRLFG